MKRLFIIAGAVLLLAAVSHGQEKAGVQDQMPKLLAGEAAPSAAPSGTDAKSSPPESAKPAAAVPYGLEPALHELSPWTMFMWADVLVEAVMVSLAFASLITWTIFLAKSVTLTIAQGKLKKSLSRIAAARTLSEAALALGPKPNVLRSFLAAASEEIRLSPDGSSRSGVKERTASRFSEIVRSESRAIRQGMGILATIGSTAPFVGLFGTVWGIMNSFVGISKSQTTNLAVVAPGIAEALLATACGLVAAIPAVMIYNYLTRLMRGYLDLVSQASGAAGRLVSRSIEAGESHLDIRVAE